MEGGSVPHNWGYILIIRPDSWREGRSLWPISDDNREGDLPRFAIRMAVRPVPGNGSPRQRSQLPVGRVAGRAA